MPITIRENQALKNKSFVIPDKLETHLKQTLAQYSNCTTNKGYRRLNKLVNDDYNKRSDKDKETKDGKKTMSLADLKNIDFFFRHSDKNPNNIDRILNGGEDMARFTRDTLNRERTKVAPILKQERVKTLEKNKVKPTKNPMKPIEIGNIEANVHENKKIYISSEQFNLLKEYRNQLTIPFDGKEGKYNYEHFIDYLESFGKYGRLPNAKNPNLYDYFEEYKQNAFEMYGNYTFDEHYEENEQSFCNDIFSENDDDLILYTFDVTLEKAKYLYENEEFEYLIEECLTEDGKRDFNEFVEQDFEDKIEEYGFPDVIEQDNRGLIKIMRTISIPNAFGKDYNLGYENNGTDFYKYLKNKYFGEIGKCWSFDHGEGYCLDVYNNNYDEITFIGYVDPRYVNWANTIFKQAYDLREECEIEVTKGAPIEIDSIEIKANYSNDYGVKKGDEKHLPLRQPIIVNA